MQGNFKIITFVCRFGIIKLFVCLLNQKTNPAIQRIGNKSGFRSLNEHTIVVSSVALKIILIAQTERTGNTARIVLTVAHLDHTPENCSLDNLRALCQRCHNRYDAEHRKETRLNNSIKKKEK